MNEPIVPWLPCLGFDVFNFEVHPVNSNSVSHLIVWWSGIALMLLLLQLPAVVILLSRLLQALNRHPALEARTPIPNWLGQVSVVVPTLNEAARITPCLTGLSQQSYEVRQITIVDSRSIDQTPELVKAAQVNDPRFRLLTDDPLPSGWVGRPWALHYGFLHSHSDWILGIDADTQPQPGLVASLLATAEQQGYDLISLSPQFILKDLAEFWLQPALLMTLIYRFGANGTLVEAERVMANGQCFFCRRSLLVALDGYTSARASFCDDVTLARNAARLGAKVGFLDGAKLLKVRMYEGAAETWQEWGRSLDLKDASSIGQKWGDLFFLGAVQGLPLLLTLGSGLGLLLGAQTLPIVALFGLNLSLLLIRFALLWAIRPSYDFSQAQASWTFWLSPLADPLAAYRILLSSNRKPTQWRGRQYT